MKILSVDYGDARTGLACCDAGELLASPVGVIAEWDKQRLIERIAAEATARGVGEIVVGNPLNMDGSRGARSELAASLAQSLGQTTGLPVVLWDERRTTVAATNILNTTDVRGKKRKAVIDAVAAVLILEGYLARRRNQREG